MHFRFFCLYPCLLLCLNDGLMELQGAKGRARRKPGLPGHLTTRREVPLMAFSALRGPYKANSISPWTFWRFPCLPGIPSAKALFVLMGFFSGLRAPLILWPMGPHGHYGQWLYSLSRGGFTMPNLCFVLNGFLVFIFKIALF